jgi:hypothetical protein
MKADGATGVHRVPLACTIHTLQLAKNSTIRSTVDGVRYKYCKVSIGVAQWALKSRVEGRKITFARC